MAALTLTDNVVAHHTSTAVALVGLLLGNDEVDTVQSHTTIVAHDTATTIGVGQTCEDVVVTHVLHLLGVSIEYAVVVGFAILGEDLVQLL